MPPIHGNESYPESREPPAEIGGESKKETKYNKCCKWQILEKLNCHGEGGLGKEAGCRGACSHCASSLIFGVQGWGATVELKEGGTNCTGGSCFKMDEVLGLFCVCRECLHK